MEGNSEILEFSLEKRIDDKEAEIQGEAKIECFGDFDQLDQLELEL
jgi:hypothetical protein